MANTVDPDVLKTSSAEEVKPDFPINTFQYSACNGSLDANGEPVEYTESEEFI